jgi:hypothetical protein
MLGNLLFLIRHSLFTLGGFAMGFAMRGRFTHLVCKEMNEWME